MDGRLKDPESSSDSLEAWHLGVYESVCFTSWQQWIGGRFVLVVNLLCGVIPWSPVDDLKLVFSLIDIIWLTKARRRLLNSPNWRDFAIAWRRCSDWARLLLAARIRIQLILADLAPTAVSIDPLEAAKIRAKYTHFRILVIGRANAGKTTLLKRVCNTKEDPVYSEVRYMRFALYPTPLSSFPHQQINPTSKVPTQWSFCISLIWSLTLMP